MDDANIAVALRRAVSGLEPPAGLVGDSIARGRSRRRARRSVESVSAAAVVAAVVAVAVAIPGGGRTNGAAAPAPSATNTSDATVSTPPTGPTPGDTAPTVVMTPQALLQTTLSLLPRAGRTSGYAGNSSLGDANAVFVFDDGHGAAEVGVSLDYPLPGGPLATPCNDITTTCTPRPDGSIVAVYQGNAHPGRPELPGKDWEITLLRADGIAVKIAEWNSSDGKGATVTRDEPPFTVDEALAIISSPRYSKLISQDRADAAAGLFVPDS